MTTDALVRAARRVRREGHTDPHTSIYVVLLEFATDDYGLSSLELTYRLPGNPKEVHVPLKRDEGRRTRGQYLWDLGAVKLAPGDRVSYAVNATDNDEVSGKKSGASRSCTHRRVSRCCVAATSCCPTTSATSHRSCSATAS